MLYNHLWPQHLRSGFSALDAGLLPAGLQSRLQKALNCYEKAIVLAFNPEEKASAAKKLGLAHQRHMQLNGREALEAAGKACRLPLCTSCRL